MELSLENHLTPTFPCPLCNMNDSQPTGVNKTFGKPFDVAFCPHCGLYFFPEIPSHEFLDQYYSKNYFSEYELSGISYFLKSVFERFRGLSQYLFVKSVITDEKGKKILETGSADGTFLSFFKKKSWEVKGLELSDFMRDKATRRYGIELERKEITEITPENGTYDVIAMSHVLEHMPDPVFVLRHSKSLISKDGFIFIELPFSPLPGEASRNDLDFYLQTTHLYNFTEKSLSKLIGLAGLEIIKMERFFYPVPRFYGKYEEFVGKTLMTGKIPGKNVFALDALSHTVLSMLIRYLLGMDTMKKIPLDSHWCGLGDNLRIIVK